MNGRKLWILHHKNVPVHSVLLVGEFLAKSSFQYYCSPFINLICHLIFFSCFRKWKAIILRLLKSSMGCDKHYKEPHKRWFLILPRTVENSLGPVHCIRGMLPWRALYCFRQWIESYLLILINTNSIHLGFNERYLI